MQYSTRVRLSAATMLVQDNPGLNEHLAAILAAHLNQQRGGGTLHFRQSGTTDVPAAAPARGSGTSACGPAEDSGTVNMAGAGTSTAAQHAAATDGVSAAFMHARADTAGAVTNPGAEHSALDSGSPAQTSAGQQMHARPPSLDLWGASLPSSGSVVGESDTGPWPTEGRALSSGLHAGPAHVGPFDASGHTGGSPDRQALATHARPRASFVSIAGSGLGDSAEPLRRFTSAPPDEQHVQGASVPRTREVKLGSLPGSSTADGMGSLLGGVLLVDGAPAAVEVGRQQPSAGGWLADVTSATGADAVGGFAAAEGGRSVSSAGRSSSEGADGLEPSNRSALAAMDTGWLSDVRPASGSGSSAVGFGLRLDAGLSSLLQSGADGRQSPSTSSPARGSSLVQSVSQPALGAALAAPSSPGFVHGIPRLSGSDIAGSGSPLLAGIGSLAGLGTAAYFTQRGATIDGGNLSVASAPARQSPAAAAASRAHSGIAADCLRECAANGNPIIQHREGSAAGKFPAAGAELGALSGSEGDAAYHATIKSSSGAGGASASRLDSAGSALGPLQHGIMLSPQQSPSRDDGAAALSVDSTTGTALAEQAALQLQQVSQQSAHVT